MKIAFFRFALIAPLLVAEGKVLRDQPQRDLEGVVANEDLMPENIFIQCGLLGDICCHGRCRPKDGDTFISCNAMQACAPCGETGQMCCENEECAHGNVCNRGVCMECGDAEELCCEGMKCESGSVCTEHGMCMECGNSDPVTGDPERCCEGMKCSSGFVCTPDNFCEPCGDAENSPCCDGMKCDEGLVCSHTGMCKNCGEEGDPCCEGMKCNMENDHPLVCTSDNTCVECGTKDHPCCDHEGPACGKTTLWCEDEEVEVGLKCSAEGICVVPTYVPGKH